MTADEAKRLTREQALAAFDDMKSGSGNWKQFNKEYFSAVGHATKHHTFDTMRVLQEKAYGPPSEKEQAQAAATAKAEREAKMLPVDVINEAKFELSAAKGNKEFMRQLFDPNDMGHKHANEMWNKLHDITSREPLP